MPLTWWFGGSMYNREFTGIRWSLTSVPICHDFLPPALGNTASAQFPGPQRKARFHRRDPNVTQGEACRIYLWRLPTQHIRIFIQSTFLPNLVGAQQTQYCKTGYSELCFLLNLKSSFITLLIPDRRKRPSPILFTLCSRQSPLGQVSTEMLGRWPVHIAYHGRRPALRLPSTRRKYSLLGCWRNWQLMETKPWELPARAPGHRFPMTLLKNMDSLCILCLHTSSLFFWTWGCSHITRKVAPSEKKHFLFI